MSSSSIEFDDQNQLTEGSQEAIQARAEELVSKIDLEDEQVFEELINVLEDPEEQSFFPEKLQAQLYQNLNIQDDLEKQHKIKQAFALGLCDKINQRLLIKERLTNLPTSPADFGLQKLQNFIDHLKKTSYIWKEPLEKILNSLATDLDSYQKIKTNTSGNERFKSEKDHSKNLAEARATQKAIEEMPESRKKEQLSKQIQAIIKDYEQIQGKFEKTPAISFESELKQIKNQTDQIFSDIYSWCREIGTGDFRTSRNPKTKDPTDTITVPFRNIQAKHEKFTEFIKTSIADLKNPPFSQEQINDFKSHLRNILDATKKIIDNLKNKVNSYPNHRLDETACSSIASDIFKIIDQEINSSGQKISVYINNESEAIKKIIPRSGTVFGQLESYGIYRQLGNRLKDLKTQLFGADGRAGARPDYDKSALYETELKKDQDLQKLGQKQASQLEAFEAPLKLKIGEKGRITAASDEQLLEEYYRHFLYDKGVADLTFTHHLYNFGNELARVAKGFDIETPVDLTDRAVPISEKLPAIEKVIKDLGGEEKLSPSLRASYRKLKEFPSNPEANFKRLKEKLQKVTQLKKEFIDTKNKDIVDPHLTDLKEEIKKAIVELRNLEIEIFGPRKVGLIHSTFDRERKNIAGSIKTGKDGEVFTDNSSDLGKYIKNLNNEINTQESRLKTLEKAINDAKDTDTGDRLRAEFQQTYTYLTRLQELRTQKQNEMENYVIFHPEMFASRNAVGRGDIKEALWKREMARFHSGRWRDRLLRIGFEDSPLRSWRIFWESYHTKQLDAAYMTELNMILKTGFGSQDFFTRLDHLIHLHPVQALLRRTCTERIKKILGIRQKNDQSAAFYEEWDRGAIEKLKAKYPELADQESIWNSRNIQEAIDLHRQIQKEYEASSPNYTQIAKLTEQLQNLFKESQEANKMLQNLLTLKVGGKDIREKTAELRRSEEELLTADQKRAQELFQQFLSLNPDKFYPDAQNRFQTEAQAWATVARYPHLPKNIVKNTVTPFLKALQLHFKSSSHVITPRDFLTLLKLQTANIMNSQCPLTRSEHFYADFKYLRDKTASKEPSKRIKSIRDYLDYRNREPQALKLAA